MNLMATTTQRPMIDTQKKLRKPNVTLKKTIKSQGKKAREWNREELQNKQKIIKMAINTHLSIITLNEND